MKDSQRDFDSDSDGYLRITKRPRPDSDNNSGQLKVPKKKKWRNIPQAPKGWNEAKRTTRDGRTYQDFCMHTKCSCFFPQGFFASAGTLESMNPSLAGLAYFEMIAYSDEFT
jgi:hypothetical protein